MQRSTQSLMHMAGIPDFAAFADAANRYGVPLSLLLRTAKQESGFKHIDPATGRPLTSSAGALGYMQLMPGTARELGVNPADAIQNIHGGARYLAQMLARYGGNQPLALAAYNAGPGRVDKYLTHGEPLPAETLNYVRSISAMKAPEPPAGAPKPVQTVPASDLASVGTPQGFGAAPEMPPGLLQIPGMP